MISRKIFSFQFPMEMNHRRLPCLQSQSIPRYPPNAISCSTESKDACALSSLLRKSTNWKKRSWKLSTRMYTRAKNLLIGWNWQKLEFRWEEIVMLGTLCTMPRYHVNVHVVCKLKWRLWRIKQVLNWVRYKSSFLHRTAQKWIIFAKFFLSFKNWHILAFFPSTNH